MRIVGRVRRAVDGALPADALAAAIPTREAKPKEEDEARRRDEEMEQDREAPAGIRPAAIVAKAAEMAMLAIAIPLLTFVAIG